MAPLRAIPAILALLCSAKARADNDGSPADPTPPVVDARPSEAPGPAMRLAPEGRDWHKALTPANVTITAGTLLPLFLIYEYPAPWVGVEVGWRTGTHAHVVANAGTSVIWVDGSQRYLFPLGVSLRFFPWRRGPWVQLGLGTMPYVERTGLMLPARSVSSTDFGAMLATKLGVGVRIREWDIGMGLDFNLGSSFKSYTGIETRAWEYTSMMWVGAPVWTRRQP